ncbi:MAG: hypothetical protein JNL74_14770 [Fibrobacteres bacterium]|nr:hypothetical protein [Fibrobacterota bacterium]
MALEDDKLRTSLNSLTALSEADFSTFSESDLELAALRVRTVAQYVADVNRKLITEIGPRAAEVSQKLNNLSEHLTK